MPRENIDLNCSERLRQILRSKQTAAPYLAMPGLVLLALSSGFSSALMYVSSGLLLVACILDGQRMLGALMRDPLVAALSLLLVYIVSRTVVQEVWGANGAEQGWHDAWRLIHGAGLMGILVGWWLIKRPEWLRWMLVSFLAAGVVALARAFVSVSSPPWEGAIRLTVFNSPNAFGTYFALLLIGLVSLSRTALSQPRLCPLFILKSVAWIFGVLVTSFGLLWSGSRSAWLGALVGVCSVVLLHASLSEALPNRLSVWRLVFTGLVLTCVLGVLAVALPTERLSWRLQGGAPMLDVLHSARGHWSEVGDRSLKARLYLWRGGLDAIGEKPVFGWSPSGAGRAMAVSVPETYANYPHFHNLFIHTGVTLGAVGLGAIAICAIVAIRRCVWGLKNLERQRATIILASGGLLGFAVISQFQVRCLDPVGIVPNAFFLGVLIASVFWSDGGVQAGRGHGSGNA